MASTFNRRPLSVNTPSSNDLKEHFFNHYNWKGMNANKNFLAADQETFEDCNNVYMNAEGILRSRPAVKQTDITNIIRFWNFSDVKVYLLKDSEKYKLDFVNDDNHCYLEIVNNNVNLIQKDNKIFIFADGVNFKYYDGSIKSADDYVYIPEVKVISGNETKDNESENLLTNRKNFTYIYTSDKGVSSTLIGEQISTLIDGIKYNFTYKEGSYITFYEKKFELPVSDSLCYILKTKISNADVYVCLEMSDDTFEVVNRIYVKVGDGAWTVRSSDIVRLKTDYLRNSTGISDDGLIFYLIDFANRLRFLSILPDEQGNYDFSLDIIRSNALFAHVVQKDNYLAVISGNDNDILMAVGENNEVSSQSDLNCRIKSADLRFGEFYVEQAPIYTGSFIGDFAGQLKFFNFKLYYDGLNTYGEENRSRGEGVLRGNKLLYVGTRPSDGVDLYFLAHNSSDGYVVGYGVNDITTKTIRFSDDGRFAFTAEICDLDARLHPASYKYLNKTKSQSVIVHSAGNESLYSFVGRDYLYFESVYSSQIKNPIALTVINGESTNQDFINKISKSILLELDNYYVSIMNLLQISELRKNNDGEFLWYFPKNNQETFSSSINALQAISSSEVAVFLNDEIHYVSKQEGLYSSYKSKLKTGLLDGSDVITSYDGTNVIFPTERGLVALSYQNFVASTDQTLTYLSDAISEQFKEFVKHPVKLLRYQFWILAYSPELTTAYLLDLRNNSWWPMTYHSLPTEFYVVDNEVLLLSENKLFKLDKSDEDYYDYDGTKHQINWNFKSQKLHLNAVNYYKHISNLTLYSVLDTDREMNFIMDVNNYRKQIDTTEIQTISYKVDTIRTFVKRVSYPKVNEFQYNMHQDDEREIRLPLSLSGITIKYKISGQVR